MSEGSQPLGCECQLPPKPRLVRGFVRRTPKCQQPGRVRSDERWGRLAGVGMFGSVTLSFADFYSNRGFISTIY